MKVNKKILIDYFVELYQYEKEIFGIENDSLPFMRLDNIFCIYNGHENDIVLILKEDSHSVIHNVKDSTYLEYVKSFREDKLKRIIGHERKLD